MTTLKDSISNIPDIPNVGSVNSMPPNTKPQATTFVSKVTPVDLSQIHPTVMDNFDHQSMQMMLDLSGNQGQVPPLNFCLLSYWRSVPVPALQQPYAAGTYKQISTRLTKSTTATDTQIHGSVSGMFDGGTWGGGGSVQVSTNYEVTTYEESKVTFTVPEGKVRRLILWQWTTAVAFIPQSDDPENPATMPKQYYFPFRQGTKNLDFSLGYDDWQLFGSEQVELFPYDFDAPT
ncbi:MAG: hypothetical protein GJ677_10785 [Rhodobacteraceae bacterium]|nr:hypothetical protein [Paracoccaceae bacterium]